MTSVRLAAVRRVTQLIADEVSATVTDPDRVTVIDHDPGKTLPREAIYTLDVNGTPAPGYLAGGSDQPTSDDFTIDVVCRTYVPGVDPASTYDRVDELYMATRRAVLGVAYGSDLDGLTGVSYVELGNVAGPIIGPDDQGFLGLCKVTIRVTTDEVSP